MIHENFAKLVNLSLSAFLHSMVRTQVVSIDQITYEEFTKSLHDPTVINIISLKPLPGNIILEFPTQIAFVLIDRLLGGSGPTAEKNRELNDMELIVLKQVMLKILGNIGVAWHDVKDLTPTFEDLALNPFFTPILPPTEMVIMITLEVKIDENLGLMNLCLPYMVLEPIVDRLNTKSWPDNKHKSSTVQSIASIQQRLAQAQVQVTVELGTASIKVREFLNIDVGDVILLDQPLKDLLEIKIGNQVKFKGSPGVSGSKMAIQIGQVIREG